MSYINILISLMTVFLTINAQADNHTKKQLSKQEVKNLLVTGFEVIDESQDSVTFSFQESPAIIISKANFSSFEKASEFCTSKKSTIDSESIITPLIFAMSGAITVSPFLEQALTYGNKSADDELISGIWAWSGFDTFIAMPDGMGNYSEEVSITQAREEFKDLEIEDFMQIPAICKSFKWER